MTINDLLQETMDQNFKSVVVIGFKDNNVKITCAHVYDVIEQLGLLELAKVHIISNGVKE